MDVSNDDISISFSSDFGVSGWTVNSGQRQDTVKTFGETYATVCFSIYDFIYV